MLQLNKNKLVLKCWVGNFNCFNVSFVEEGGGFPKFKIFPISNFSLIRYEGGGAIKFPIFPKFKKVQNILGKILDFFHNL